MDRRRRSASRSRSRSRPRGPRDVQPHRRRGSRSRSNGRSFSRRSRSEDRHSHRGHYFRHRSRSFSRDRFGSGRRPVSRSRSRSHYRSFRRSWSRERDDRGRSRSRSRDFRGYHRRDVRDRSWDRQRREPSRDRSAGRPARRRGRRGGRKERQRRELKEQQKRAGRTPRESRDGSVHSQTTESGTEKRADATKKEPFTDAKDAEMPDTTSDNAPLTAAASSADPEDAKPQRQPRTRSASRGQRTGNRKGARIPENWADVPKLGDIVRDSRFVPMRCPLDAKYTPLYATPDDAWSPQLFLAEQKRRGYNVGMVIDLTNTLKYYDGAAEFRDSGVEYVKLKIEGFNAPPRAQDVAQFTAIVDAFVAKDPSATIAVHCTHGLNRTGYLIAHYLVTKRGCSVSHALASFALARPPGLIKHMYVESLYKLLGDSEVVELPELPAWAADKYGKRR